MAVDEIIEQINKLSVLELVELKDKLQEQWGVQAMAPMAFAGGAAGPAEAVAVEEKDTFTVKIESVGDQKIQVIKAVRALTNLGLKEAKELVEAAPNAVVAEDIGKDEAENIRHKLEESGAAVNVE